MRDATYVMLALALCSLIAVTMSMQKPRAMYMLELEDFKHLPVELRSALRHMLPDPNTIRQRWAMMTPDQKRSAIQQLGGFIPQPRSQARPHVVAAEPVLVKPAPPVEEQVPVVVHKEEEPVVVAPELKKGFLNTVEKGKKKDAKNKKQNEVVALRAVGADVPATPGDDGFLGGDE